MDACEEAARKAWRRPWPFDPKSEYMEAFRDGWNAAVDGAEELIYKAAVDGKIVFTEPGEPEG